jgi:hypothetical protein
MAIEWFFPAATPEQLRRARDAALEEFKSYRIQPEIAAVAKMEMQAYEGRSRRGPLPHPDSERGALVFARAQVAANLAAMDSGAPVAVQKQGYIRVDIDPASWAGYFLRESRVLNWVDPEEPAASSN